VEAREGLAATVGSEVVRHRLVALARCTVAMAHRGAQIRLNRPVPWRQREQVLAPGI